jgi:hypothetical protein
VRSIQVRQIRDPHDSGGRARSGIAAVDYMLTLGVVLPLLVVVLPAGRRAMQLIFELACTLVAWPFM